MERTQRFLLQAFSAFLGVSIVLVALFETDLLPCGMMKGIDASGEFVVATAMELVTLCVVPLALRLFRFRCVSKRLTDARALLCWGFIRMLMLCVPMVVNTLLYYVYMNVAFGYMGIVLLISLAFVWPTKSRCESEIRRP